MKHTLLMTTSAVALVAATSIAFAQGVPENGRGTTTTAPSAAPADKSTPAEKMAPAERKSASDSMERKLPPGAAVKTDDKALPQKSATDTKMAPPASSAQGKAEMKGNQDAPAKSTEAPAAGNAPKSAQTAAPAAAPQTSGSAGTASVALPAEQQVKVRELVTHDRNAPRMSNATFSLNVGVVIPKTVRYIALPPRVIEIHPAWRGYSYFLVGDEIIVVEPGTRRIVAVIPA